MAEWAAFQGRRRKAMTMTAPTAADAPTTAASVKSQIVILLLQAAKPTGRGSGPALPAGPRAEGPLMRAPQKSGGKQRGKRGRCSHVRNRTIGLGGDGRAAEEGARASGRWSRGRSSSARAVVVILSPRAAILAVSAALPQFAATGQAGGLPKNRPLACLLRIIAFRGISCLCVEPGERSPPPSALGRSAARAAASKARLTSLKQSRRHSLISFLGLRWPAAGLSGRTGRGGDCALNRPARPAPVAWA